MASTWGNGAPAIIVQLAEREVVKKITKVELVLPNLAATLQKIMQKLYLD